MLEKTKHEIELLRANSTPEIAIKEILDYLLHEDLNSYHQLHAVLNASHYAPGIEIYRKLLTQIKQADFEDFSLVTKNAYLLQQFYEHQEYLYSYLHYNNDHELKPIDKATVNNVLKRLL